MSLPSADQSRESYEEETEEEKPRGDRDGTEEDFLLEIERGADKTCGVG